MLPAEVSKTCNSLFFVQFENCRTFQMMVVIIDKLLKTQIIECSAVASWIFSPEMTSELTRYYLRLDL